MTAHMAKTKGTRNAQRFWRGGVINRRHGGRSSRLDGDFEEDIRDSCVKTGD
jgi:hypothetical protein